MKNNLSGNRDIQKDRLRDEIIGKHRDGFIGSFDEKEPKMKPMAGKVFDAYVAAGGDFREEDMKCLKEIVEDNFSQEAGNDILTKCAIDEVRFHVRGKTGTAGNVIMIQRLPRKGNASVAEEETPAPKGRALKGDTAEELLRELRAYSLSLKPPRVPSEMVPKVKAPERAPCADAPPESVVKRLNEIPWTPEEKKQA